MLVHLQPVGDRGMYYMNVVGGGVDPGWGAGRPGGHPDQGLPGGGHISNRPPGSWEGRPDQSLPGSPGHPSQGLPGGGQIDNNLPGAPGHPDNRPPSQPPQVQPGHTLVMIRSADGKWHYASIAPGSPPPRPEPVPPHPSGQPVPPQVNPQQR